MNIGRKEHVEIHTKITQYLNVALTIFRHVDLAVAGEELEALALRLELRSELFGRDLGKLGLIIAD